MSRVGHSDLAELREGEAAADQLKHTSGQLKDYSGNHVVTIHWDMNPESTEDQMFILRIDDKEVYLDKQELLRYTRLI